jgi:hypothetical protein
MLLRGQASSRVQEISEQKPDMTSNRVFPAYTRVERRGESKMQQVNLETRPLYGIGTVARLTGLKPDTLRVWERRYGLGASHK